ncbi:MAG: acetyl-CoA carboxylase biotin carboxyl carrier protein subunit [Longimicrobiales bacterium]
MRYFVTLADRTFVVDLEGDDVRVDGEPVDADLGRVADSGFRHLLLDGESFPLVARRGEEQGSWELHVGGQRWTLDVVDERTRAIRAMTGAAAGPKGPRPIRAPMPGLVVRIEVAIGDDVAQGDGVAIVEAMKMQNELRAESAGRVAKIHAAAGQAVEKGALLVEFEAG